MIELERHIEILLLSNDCVIVPNFGGFMAHHVEARYDEQEGIFLPPQRTIGFNPQLTLNDSLLAQSYIEAYDISYPEAIRRIADEVRELKQHLDKEGSYELFDLGVLSVNQFGKYEFEPCEAGILTPELYGLSSYKMPVLAENLASVSNAADNVSETSTSQAVMLFEEQEDDDSEERTIRLSTLRNIAAACIAIIAFFVVSSPISNSASQQSQARINTSMLLPITPSLGAGSSEKVNTPRLNRDSISAPKSNHSEDINMVTAEPISYYTIVLCSRVTIKNAQRYVEQLQKEGLEDASVLTKGKYTKVVLGHYTSEEEASSKSRQLNGNYGIADCWVTKVVG